jgi:DNA-binding GntR family transcriptional regulator
MISSQKVISIPYRTKTQIAYDYLKECILTAILKPGEPIIISGVAHQLGMSEIPVREALQRLQASGLIATTPHASVQVADLNLEDLKEIFEVRVTLEGFAARLAATKISQESIEELERLLAETEEEMGKRNFEKVSFLNRRFHDLIYEASGNKLLHKTIADLWEKTSRMYGVFTLVPERIQKSLEEHKSILEAIKKRLPKRAQLLTEKQKSSSFKSMQAYLRKTEKD